MRKTFRLVPALLVPLFLVAACTSAEEKAKQREAEMIEQAKADSAAEADFVKDSITLAASITVDTITAVRTAEQRNVDDEGNEYSETVQQAVSPTGHTCILTLEKARSVIVGDTISCQWSGGPVVPAPPTVTNMPAPSMTPGVPTTPVVPAVPPASPTPTKP